jgi:hypothetical protein
MSDQAAFIMDGGVGHGGFVAAFVVAGNVILDPFTRERPAKTIPVPNQIGAPRKQASVRDFRTATATAQIEVDDAGNTPVFVQEGDTFVAPANFGGEKWYVESASDAHRSGDFWKSELRLRKVYN